VTSPVPFPLGNTAADFADIIIDSAVAYQGSTPISVARGGLKFEPNEVWENYTFPGKTMPVVGLDEVVSSRPTISGTMMMTGEAQFTVYRSGGSWGDAAEVVGIITTGARAFTPGAFRSPLAEGSYLQDLFVVWKRQRGDFIAVQFPFALCTHYGISSADGDEGQIAVEFEARQANDGTPATSPPYTVIVIPPTFEVPDPGDTPPDVPPEGGALGNGIFDVNADTLALTLSDNDPVPTWGDDIGSNDAGLAVGQTAPTFKANGLGSGKPSVRFTSGGTTGLAYNVPASSTQTRYIVAKLTTGAGTDPKSFNAATVFSGHGASNIKDIGLGLLASGKLVYSIGENALVTTFRSTTTPSAETGALHLFVLTYDAVTQRGKIFVDDMVTEVATDVYPIDAGLFDDWPTEYMGLGGSSITTSIGMDLGRMYVYDAAHNATQRAQVKAVLQARWGTP
jgi:hypothetical protein